MFESIDGIGDHLVCKIPHHGSLGSIDDAWAANGRRDRMWVVTPFNKGSYRLRRFEDEQGAARLLEFVDELSVTSLPHADGPANEVERPSRSQIRDWSTKKESGPLHMHPPGGPQSGAVVAVEIDEDGSLVRTLGPRAKSILE